MMFYQAWMDIRNKMLTKDSDWVVKVDADAVFLPIRLLNTLHGYKVPEGGAYIENCHKVAWGFFGNLEVVSQDGFSTFLSNLENCKSSLDWKGEDPKWKYGPWGEDLFMQKCLDKIGVPKVSNFTISQDGACPADRPKELQKVKNLKWKPNCLDPNAVAYHPFKHPDEYFECAQKNSEDVLGCSMMTDFERLVEYCLCLVWSFRVMSYACHQPLSVQTRVVCSA